MIEVESTAPPFVLFGQESEVPRRFVAFPDGLSAHIYFDGVHGDARIARAYRGRLRDPLGDSGLVLGA